MHSMQHVAMLDAPCTHLEDAGRNDCSNCTGVVQWCSAMEAKHFLVGGRKEGQQQLHQRLQAHAAQAQ